MEISLFKNDLKMKELLQYMITIYILKYLLDLTT